MNKKEPEKELIRFIECGKCGFVESMPANIQRWHSQFFDFVECVDSEAVYTCPNCNTSIISYSEFIIKDFIEY